MTVAIRIAEVPLFAVCLRQDMRRDDARVAVVAPEVQSGLGRRRDRDLHVSTSNDCCCQ